MRINYERMVDVLGRTRRPDRVWQRQFDYFDEKLHELAATNWEDINDVDLRYYFLDLTYVELQDDLLRHVFPACLRFWYETLMRDKSADQGDSNFHLAINRGQFVDKHFSCVERRRLYSFFCDGLMDRIEVQSSFDYIADNTSPSRSGYYWINRFNTLGVVAPIIVDIWSDWWKLDNKGKVVCGLIYLSGLIYFSDENPIKNFLGLNRQKSHLSLLASELDDLAWQEENLIYLKNALSVEFVTETLEKSVTLLEGTSDADIVTRMRRDANHRKDIICIRIEDLLENLSKNHLKDRWE